MNSPIFVPCSPIFSLARASIQLSNGVEDFLSESKTTNGRSPIFPYSRLCSSVPGGGEAEGAVVEGEAAFVKGEGAGGGEESRNSVSNFSRASGGKFSLFKSASSSARSVGPSLPGSNLSPLAP